MAGKISLALNVILLGAVIYLFTQIGGNNIKDDQMDSTAAQSDSTEVDQGLKLAYVNMDSVMVNFDLATELFADLTKQEGTIKRKIESKMASLEKQAQEVQFNPDIKTEQDYQNFIQGLSVQAENYQQRKMLELEQKTYEVQDTLGKIIENYIDELVLNSPYDFIFRDGAASNLLHGNDAYDLTTEMTSKLNADYSQDETQIEE